jgi:titin
LTGSVGGARVITLHWTDHASNETGFYIERADKAKTLQFSRIATVGANVTAYSRTEAAGTWIYRVQAFNGVGASGYSNNVTLRLR